MKPDQLDLIEAAVKQATEEGRERLGGPPSREELLAYRRGELSPDERELIEERLAHHPEAVRQLLALPKPADRRTPAVSDSISDEEVEDEWAVLQAILAARRPTPATPQRPVSTGWALAVAASLLVAALGVGSAVMVRRDAISPKTGIQDILLYPDEAHRGGEARSSELDPAFEGYVVMLKTNPDQDIDYPRHRLEIASEEAPATPIWSTDVLPREGAVSLLLHRSFLDRGSYQLRLYGLRGDSSDLLGVYHLRVM